MGFIHSLSYPTKFTGSIHGLRFLPKVMRFIHRLSFLPKFGANVAWWPFSTPQLFIGYHKLPKVSRGNVKLASYANFHLTRLMWQEQDREKELLLKGDLEV
jgi:hypothetical protein